MATTKNVMTERDFNNGIIDLLSGEVDISNEMEENLRAQAKLNIEKLNAKNERRKNEPTKAQKENAVYVPQILEMLSSKSMIASEIGEALNISTSKASAICRQLAIDGKLVSEEVKHNKSKVKQYSLA